jgi:predicted transcriptional regulator of viral defense system
MKTSIIWEKLMVEGQRIATSEQIQHLSNQIEKKYPRSLKYLQEKKYIYRILKGIFYVKSPEERERNYFQLSQFEMISMALQIKGVKNWYFGLETALKINNMTHEYFTVNYVITDSYRTTKIIQILDSKFKFIKRRKENFKFGIIKKNGLRYSDKEKTVLDLTYQRYLKRLDPKFVISPVIEYQVLLDNKKLFIYLEHYSKRFEKFLSEKL